MPNIKEDLVELLNDVCAKGFWRYGVDQRTGEEGGHLMTAEDIADYLMENGVTVQKWIPVTERLPEDRQKILCFKKGKYASCVMTANYSKCLEKYCDVDFHGVKHGGFFNYDSEVGYYELSDITHWMPLPPAPEENK